MSDCQFCGGRTRFKAYLILVCQVLGKWDWLVACDYCGAPLLRKWFRP